MDVLPRYLRGEVRPVPQPEEGVTYCRPLKKQDGRLDWTRPAAELERQVRAVTPWPGAFTFWEGQMLKVLRAAVHPDWAGTEPPGTVVRVGDGAAVVTGQGALGLIEVQIAGKNPLPIEAFLRGRRNFIGAVLE
jgi:methionyl-tRNA formyltransferase